MKALGIVRRIDDLGRVVIPKELRRTLKINESDALEIFTDERGEIILRKYSPVADRLSAFVAELARVLGVIADVNVIITDTDKVVTSWGNLAKRLTRGLPSLGPAIQCVLENGLPEEWSNINTDNEAQHLVDIHEGDYGDYPKVGSQYIVPIAQPGADDIIEGTVIILSENQKLPSEQKAQADLIAAILSSKLA